MLVMAMVYAWNIYKSVLLDCPCGGWGWWWMAPAWWASMALLSVVFLIVVLFFLFWVIGRLYSSGRQAHSPLQALEILKERLARGEITEEEYRRLKKILEE